VTQKGGRVYIPQAVEAFTYDDDGNLTSDGRWNYTWDAENRLISMEARPTVPIEAKLRLEFAYDYMGRRIQKKVYNWNVPTSTYQLQSTTKFVYDGWNLGAELDGNNVLLRGYAWGNDLSATLQGAGGAGGLLFINEGGTTYYTGYDGNGNVALLIKNDDSTTVASYDYDASGRITKAVGSYVTHNRFTFGTVYTDQETGLFYYGYRYFDPELGRWLSRDPLTEIAAVNLYAFLANNSINLIEQLGLDGLVIAGGTSVNDPNAHDKFAWNFLNAAARRANALVQEYKNSPKKYKDAKVYVIMYTPSYERRAQFEGKPSDYFLKIMQAAAQRGGWQLVTISSAPELTYHFNKSKTKGVTSIDYFGHSNAELMFLEYSSVTPEISTDYWGEDEARKVRKEIFSVETKTSVVRGRRVVTTTPTAIFSTYGCNQGDPGGLAERLHQLWGIVTQGSRGKTDFAPIGRGETYPSTEGGYVIFR